MTQTKTLTIEPNYPIKPVTDIQNILVVGCGGTGSYIIPNLARIVANSKTPVCLTIADADVVEEKNLLRQNFIKSDVGKNKAEALAKRYSSAFGIQVQYLAKYLEKPDDIASALRGASVSNMNYGNTVPLVISCVDNIKARKVIVDALVAAYPHGAYLVDCGNEEQTGQVLLSVITDNKVASTGVYRTPHIFEVYPELTERLKTDKFASELSCAEMAESSPQFGFVNLNAATIAMNFIYDLINKNPITTYMVEFSIKNKFSQRALNQTTVKSWTKSGITIKVN
jgi:PRTRC genetic system ThiF family protein